jgi:hypothetical protein
VEVYFVAMKGGEKVKEGEGGWWLLGGKGKGRREYSWEKEQTRGGRVVEFG